MKEELAKTLLEKTRRDYDLIAEEFSQTRPSLWPELVEKFQDTIKDGDRILDIGCGNGRLIDLLGGKKLDYVGVDNSAGQVEQARKRCPQSTFLVADALNLPFADRSFDKVFAIALLHHIPSRALRLQVFQEAGRVLKDKGFLILTVWDRWLSKRCWAILKYLFLRLIGKAELDDFGDAFVPWKSQPSVQRYYHFFTREEIMKLAREAGFVVTEAGVIRNETGQRQNLYLVAQKPYAQIP